MKGYFYHGKHRAPTNTGRRIAALTAATAIPMLAANGVAFAATPNWDPIIQCESGGNPTAKNPGSTASGLFQFINGTWRAYGGLEFAPTARQATVQQQYIVANRAYADAGFSPWNASRSCWGNKVSNQKPEMKPAPKVTKTASVPKPAPKVEKKTEIVVAKPIGSPTLGGEGEYTVRSGDTLSGIAQLHNTTWQELHAKNTLTVEHPDWIWPGEKLDI